MRRLVRYRRRALAAGLAVTAAALVAAGPGDAAAGRSGGPPPGGRAAGVRSAGDDAGEQGRERGQERERRRAAERVGAPVRIADGATVRLLEVGDRVDVIAVAAAGQPAGGAARVVARGARVAQVPERAGESEGSGKPEGSQGSQGSEGFEGFEPSDGVGEAGALVVLSVPRGTAARLAGAGATSRLAVTLC